MPRCGKKKDASRREVEIGWFDAGKIVAFQVGEGVWVRPFEFRFNSGSRSVCRTCQSQVTRREVASVSPRCREKGEGTMRFSGVPGEKTAEAERKNGSCPLTVISPDTSLECTRSILFNGVICIGLGRVQAL